MFAVYPFPDPLLPELRLWSDEEKAANRKALLDANPDPDGTVWVFGYGSLIWDPRFSFVDRRKAVLPGHERRFSFWTMRSRGTRETPGLGLAIEARLGSCEAIAYRMDPSTLDDDLEALWHREMAAGVYVPVWHDVETPQGTVSALCFIANPAHTSYAGDLPLDRIIAVIARAAGSNGPCRDYLAHLVAALDNHRLFDPAMSALLRMVDAERETI
ncbi:MAG: gamma-glutamylcyclotransferase [Alphaproteobacteria bacterium]